MTEFQLEIDVSFFAEDIDDAFAKLGEHFKALAEGRETELELELAGKMDIRPREE